ncbi:hypothetical protein CHCC14820_2526 [Bacillus paralicheniformis]|jgi:hypothetical protein|nr:hypothetical protein DJ88_2481 [Bacillus paralicheniformis]TWJ58541.1 hypothetical protein CHCC5022_3396 [Bacillus paralicheniformis]TWJ60732.1 hypothetical protein CHCC5023_0849 [Bacillus paralicheniformis]TWJ61073.1 hypothetical protein CHCC5021_3829 [Bacillus paralicheniformis]TWJ76076.1 hypothetical protein CHCC4186_1250 [Bacillus paralicheniformis]
MTFLEGEWNLMKSIQAITVHSKQYIVGEPCHPPGFKDEATVMKITEKNKFYGLIRGFVVHFDTKTELHIHTEPVKVYWR